MKYAIAIVSFFLLGGSTCEYRVRPVESLRFDRQVASGHYRCDLHYVDDVPSERVYLVEERGRVERSSGLYVALLREAPANANEASPVLTVSSEQATEIRPFELQSYHVADFPQNPEQYLAMSEVVTPSLACRIDEHCAWDVSLDMTLTDSDDPSRLWRLMLIDFIHYELRALDCVDVATGEVLR